MINKLSTFDPSLNATGQLDTHLTGQFGTLYLINESLETLQLSTDDNLTLGLLPALWAQPIHISFPPSSINWKVISSQALVDTTLHEVQGISYTSNEDVSMLYSGPLNRVTGIGNPGGIATVVDHITNDGNSAGTSIVEATVTGQTSSSVKMWNDGTMNISLLLSGVLTQILKLQATGNPVQLGALAKIVEIIGSLTVDQNMLITGTLGVTGATTLGTLNSGAFTSSGNITATNNVASAGAGQLQQFNTITDSGGTSWASITAGITTRIQSPTSVNLQVPVGTTVVGVNAGAVNVSGSITSSSDMVSNGNVFTNATVAATNAGTLQGFNTVSDFGGSNWASITAGTTTRIQSPGKVTLQVPAGTDIAFAQSDGLHVTTLIGNSMNDSGGNGVLSITAGSNVRIQNPVVISFQVPAGSTVGSAKSDGLHAIAMFFAAGSITRISSGQQVMASAGTTVTHNLGATPDIILLQTQSGSSTSTTGYDSVGATTFKGYSFGSLSTAWLAIKF